MLLTIVALTAVYRGFLGLATVGGTSVGTWVIDGITAICGVALVLALAVRQRPVASPWLLSSFGGLVAVSLVLCLVSPEPWGVKLLALRNQVLYAVLAVYGVQFLSAAGARTVEAIVRWAGLGIAVFGMLQFFLRAVLPEWLLKPADAGLFGYWGTDIVRANGLVGNTIVYAALLLLLLAMWWTRVFAAQGRTRWIALAATVMVCGAMLATFSRMGMLLGFAILAVTPVFAAARRGRRALIRTGGTLVGVALVGILVALIVEPLRDRVLNSWIVRELFSQGNASVTESTDLHFEMIEMALRHLQGSPLLGIGYGTQSAGSAFSTSSDVITDGAHWATLTEGGLLLTAVTLAFFVIIVVRLFRAWRHAPDHVDASRALAVALYVCAQFFIASLLNSGFYGKAPFVTFWIVAGCALVAASGAPRKPDAAADPSGEVNVPEHRQESARVPASGAQATSTRRRDPDRKED
ncbi:MAG: hypothetical protein EOO67_01770 [Microbacterium sp.]|nr:MAG: hypothetical protein EOO67_01770 [Microbacterium sp.]